MKQRVHLFMEMLETRSLLSTSPLTSAGIYSIDGSGNNIAHPEWGKTGSDYLRIAPANYADGFSTPSGADRPSARAISNAVVDHPEGDLKNDRYLTNFVYAWGQFIDHDLDLTNASEPAEAFGIAVPTGDPQFDPAGTGTQTIPLTRSKFDSATGTTNARQQVNDITAFIDGSMIYGSDATRAAALRTFSGGKLKTSAGNMLPFNTAGLDNAPSNSSTFYLAGDVRANENIELTSIQVLFVREHNFQADRIAKANPTWTDEQVYQAARKIVIAEVQAITYNEFLPALLGPNAIRRYTGYKAHVNAGISNEFASAAFRFGHSMVGDDVEFLDAKGKEIRDAVSLSQAFFNPNLVQENGIEPLLKYLASDHAEEVDTHVVESLRNLLFGPPGAGGLDLASLNIQRGRDHGLADYNTVRAAYGLPRVKNFAQITRDPAMQQALQKLYGSVDKIDLWVGGLAEDHAPGGSVGPTFKRILADQFTRSRDGDRLWYQRTFSGKELGQIEHTRLADLIRRNSTTTVQDNVFVFQVAVSGSVFIDRNANGRQDRNERGRSGVTVELIHQVDGTVVASKKTDAQGRYRFDTRDGLALGDYKVRITLPTGTQGGTLSKVLSLTNGSQFLKDVNFSLQTSVALPGTTNRSVASTTPRNGTPRPASTLSASDAEAAGENAISVATRQLFDRLRKELLTSARGVLTQDQFEAFASGLMSGQRPPRR